MQSPEFDDAHDNALRLSGLLRGMALLTDTPDPDAQEACYVMAHLARDMAVKLADDLERLRT